MTMTNDAADPDLTATSRSTDAEHVRRGRPRSPDRDGRILNATLELLETIGYDQTRVQDIAQRAKVGLGTIYRRWPTKQDLVIAAIRLAGDTITTAPSTGDPQRDLVAIIDELARQMRGTSDAFLPGLIAAIQTEPEIAVVVRLEVIEAIRAKFRHVLQDALGEELHDDDLRVDIAPALLFYRLLLDKSPEPPEQLAHRIAELIPANGRHRQPPERAPGRDHPARTTPHHEGTPS